MGVVVKLKDIDAPSDAINRVKQAILKAGERPGTPWPANFKESDFAALAFRTLKSLLPELNLPQERPAELSASGTDVVFDGGKSKIVFETRMREVDGKFYAELEGDFHEAVSGMLYDHDLLFVVLLPDDTTGRQAQAIRSYFSKHTHSQLFQSRALILNRSEVRGFLFGGSSASESGKQERSAESKKTEPSFNDSRKKTIENQESQDPTKSDGGAKSGDNVSSLAAIHMLDDEAIQSDEHDILGFRPYADAIFALIDDPKTTTPFCMAINGRWGTGKSSLANLVKKRLESKSEGVNERAHTVYWFNAWAHDEAEHVGPTFMADIARFCHQRLPWWRRVLRPLPLELRDPEHRARRRTLWVSVLFGISTFVAWIIIGNLASEEGATTEPQKLFGFLVDASGSTVAIAILMAVLIAVFPKLLQMLTSVGAFVAEPGKEANFGLLGRVRVQLEEMIADSDVTHPCSKFVVFIDDLERCRDTKAVEVLEVVNQLINFPPVVAIIVADMPAVAAQTGLRYERIAELHDPDKGVTGASVRDEKAAKLSYGRVFLQKFVQLQFDVPVQTPKQIRILMDRLVGADEGAPVTEDKPSRLSMRRLWHFLTLPVNWFVAYAAKPWSEGENKPSPSINSIENRLLRWSVITLFLPLFITAWLATKVSRQEAFQPSTETIRSQLIRWTCYFSSGVSLLSWFGLVFIFLLYFLIFPVIGIFLGLNVLNESTDVRDFHHFLFPFGSETTVLNFISYSPLLPALIFYSVLLPLVTVLSTNIASRLRLAKLRQLTSNRRHEAEKEVESALSLDELRSGGKGHFDSNEYSDESVIDPFILEAFYRKLGSDSEIFKVAREEALKHIDLTPRNVKRLTNRLRLLLFVLSQTRLIGGESLLDARHLGKWVALQEGWPELAIHLRDYPADVSKLEGDQEVRDEVLLRISAGFPDDEELTKLLKSAPELKSVIEMLTDFRPHHIES